MKSILSVLLVVIFTQESMASKVILVVLENTAASQAQKHPNFGWIAKNGAYLSNYYGVTHPSQPNYIALIAGDTLGVKTNNEYRLEGDHLGNLLQQKGLQWKTYADGYPGDCFLGKKQGAYSRKHNPFLSFANVQDNPTECARVVNSASFLADAKAGRLPDFTLYIPDNDNNGHDTGIEYADRWLGKNWIPLLKDPQFLANHTVIFTFDEDDGREKNRVYAAVIGAHVKRGFVSAQTYNHYSLLKTIEVLFRLGSLGRKDDGASAINDIWD